MEFKDSPNQTRLKERPATAPRRQATTAPVVEEAAPVVAAPVTEVAPAKHERSLFRAELIVYYILGVIEAFLVIRLILSLLNLTGTINQQSGFARFIYTVADPLCKPFYGLFNTVPSSEPAVGVIITAIVVYGLVGWGIAKLFRIGRA